MLENPEKEAAAANFPLPSRRRDFIRKAILSLKETSKGAAMRLRWVSFDKAAFEVLLSKFSLLNDNMTNLLDARLQVEIRHTVQDTNRGVLQLHHKIADLGRLVMALNLKLDATASVPTTPMSAVQKEANATGLRLLSQLAKFKAFNESIEADTPAAVWDEATAMCLGLGKPAEQRDLRIDRSRVQIDPAAEDSDLPRCEALLTLADGTSRQVWVEWKEYERQRPSDLSPPKEVIIERVRKLAALLNHEPKPEAFRTPHCLGYFDKASPDAGGEDEEDILNMRLGIIFDRPQGRDLHPSLPPVSLRELLKGDRKPSVTDRVALAHTISNCLLSLHIVDWLHKGLRSHNILFFRAKDGSVDYSKPYLSGFDFSRPARPDEMTDVPGDDAEFNLYRHPHAQSTNPGERERFRKSFDIYSVGVIFVEIAHWATVDEILGISLNAARGRPSIALRVRDNLLAREQVAELAANMGRVYGDATRKCISGGRDLGLDDAEDEMNDTVAAKLSMAFFEEVVKSLGEVRV